MPRLLTRRCRCLRRLVHPCILFSVGCFAGFFVPVAASPLQRTPNTTLSLPVQPQVVGYALTNAFPGLNFNQPLGLVAPLGETNRLFVVEKTGRIQLITNLSQPSKTLFLDVSSRVNAGDEGGLLGLAFHPGYATNRQFFVFYTLDTTTVAGTGLHDRLSRFQVSSENPNAASPDSEVPLITQFDRASNHNAGDLHFGPDGYLYVALGDEGAGGDAYGNGQRIDHNFFSGILRLDVDARPGSLPPNPHPAVHTSAPGAAYYRIPVDNPFVGVNSFNGAVVNPDAVRTEFWAVGLRNPWRMSFDPFTGLLFCGDVGQGAREEIDVIEKGANYGWSFREGTLPYAGTPPVGVTFREPILDYARTGTPGDPVFQGECVIGGVVYRGDRIPELAGQYVFGDYLSGRIWALRYDGTNATGWRWLTNFRPVGFGVDPANGDILIVGGDVTIQRLVYLREVIGDPLPPTLAATGAFSDLVGLAPEAGIVPYDINAPFWSDHARKYRWFSIPDTNLTLGFAPVGNWSFPTGTVWIKHFELQLTNGVPESTRRLETRFLVRNLDGVYGITYRWGDSLADAELVPIDGLDESFVVNDGGILRTQVWRYPSRTECLRCHTHAGGLALGFNTAQLNRGFNYDGTVTNQLLALGAAGYFAGPPGDPAALPEFSPASDESVSLTHRVRSYLAANCAQCHQPGGGTPGLWDARFDPPLFQAGILEGPLANSQGNPANRVIRPGSLAHSMMFTRLASLGAGHMPPLATSELNHDALALLSRWITNELVSVSVTLSTNRLAYPPCSGWQLLDPSAQLTFPDLGSWTGTRLVVRIADGAMEDRLNVLAAGPIGMTGSSITFGGVVVGGFSGGTNGFTPLIVTFGTNSTREVVQAVVHHLAYANPFATPFTAPRRLDLTLETFYGITSTPTGMTVDLSVVTGLQPGFNRFALTPDGQMQLTFTGQAQTTYRLEFSVDLTEWHDLAGLETGPTGIGTYSGSPGAANATACFYRLVWP